MNKQIIIDGVDVAECKNITNYENVLFVCQETGKKCEINKDAPTNDVDKKPHKKFCPCVLTYF